jgi:prepilin-type N-terminal cleavage/methylation domain-containing protein
MQKVLYKKGFTLIEMVLVMVILVVVGLAIYGTFANGLSIWKRITQHTQSEDVNLFFEKLSFDLRNSFKLTGIKFRGGRSEVSFPTRFKTSDGMEVKDSIGQVTYSFNRRKRTLNKREADYSDVYHKKSGKERVLAEDINSLQFEYFIYDLNEKKYSWVKSWQEKDTSFGVMIEENLPLIVRVELSVGGDPTEKKYVRTIPIPSACCWQMDEDVE